MEYVVVAVVFAVVVGALFAKRRFDVQKHADIAAPVSAASATGDASPRVDRSKAVRRAKAIASRQEKKRVELKVIGDERTPAAFETYRAAYELITRGIDVQLDMADVTREFGAASGVFDVISPHTSSRMTYTAEAFAPHLASIGSMDDFQRYAPFRLDCEMWLSVHPDDLDEAYEVLRELGIRLSAMHHPDQMWWEPGR